MICLIDFDSILYKAVYRVVSFNEIRTALSRYETKAEAKEWLLQEVYEQGINRAENEILKILNYIDSLIPEKIVSNELYITTCEKSFRKNLSKTYKANRKKNSYVWLLREHYRNNGAHFSSTLEADDLISIRAKNLGIGNYIVVSLDKDLKQIGGHYWSYYTTKSFDFFGDPVLNEYGDQETEFKQKEIEFIEPMEAEKIFWTSMLVGDASDNIMGVKGIGSKTAEKLLKESKSLFMTVARTYLTKSTKKDFRINYKLLRLK